MKKIMLFAVLALFFSATAFADTTTTSGAQAGAQSGSVSNVTQNSAPLLPYAEQAKLPEQTVEFGGNVQQQYWNYIPAAQMVKYKQIYGRNDVADIVAKEAKKIEEDVHFLPGRKATNTIAVVLSPGKPVNSAGEEVAMEQCGHGVIKAHLDETNSFMLFDAMCLAGMNKGADCVVISGQGIQSFMSASSFGVALGFSPSYIGGSGMTNGGSGSIGIGYVSGTAGRVGSPFLQVTYLRIKK